MFDFFGAFAPDQGGGGFGQSFGQVMGWDDIADPFGGWGSVLDQDGDLSTSSKFGWRDLLKGAGGQNPRGGQGRYPGLPSMIAPGAPLPSIPPQYIPPLLNMWLASRGRGG